MKITEQQQLLINEATNSIVEEHRKFVRELMVLMAEASTWFYEILFKTIKNGVTFTSIKLQDSKVAASFQPSTNKVILSESFLSASVPKAAINEIVSKNLRHELTHALDHADHSIGQKKFLINLLGYAQLANALINQLTKIQAHHQVNQRSLDHISQSLFQLNNTLNEFKQCNAFGDLAVDPEGIINNRIILFGSYPLPVLRNNITIFEQYIFQSWAIPNTSYFIAEISTNPLLTTEAFNNTKSIREQFFLANFGNYEFNQEILALWGSLSEKQRKTLSVLYQIFFAIINNIPNDNICTPKLDACLATAKQDCLNQFLTCQKNDIPKWLISNLEIHASLREHLELNSINLNTVNGLTNISNQHRVNTSEFEPSQQLVNISVIHSAAYSFIDTLFDAYNINKNVRNAIIWNVLINIMFTSGIGYLHYCLTDEKEASAAFQIGMPILLTCVNKAIDSYKLSISKSFLIAAPAAVATAVIKGPSEAVKGFVPSVISSTVGRFLAKSMAYGFGWRKKEPLVAATESEENNIATHKKST